MLMFKASGSQKFSLICTYVEWDGGGTRWGGRECFFMRDQGRGERRRRDCAPGARSPRTQHRRLGTSSSRHRTRGTLRLSTANNSREPCRGSCPRFCTSRIQTSRWARTWTVGTLRKPLKSNSHGDIVQRCRSSSCLAMRRRGCPLRRSNSSQSRRQRTWRSGSQRTHVTRCRQ